MLVITQLLCVLLSILGTKTRPTESCPSAAAFFAVAFLLIDCGYFFVVEIVRKKRQKIMSEERMS